MRHYRESDRIIKAKQTFGVPFPLQHSQSRKVAAECLFHFLGSFRKAWRNFHRVSAERVRGEKLLRLPHPSGTRFTIIITTDPAADDGGVSNWATIPSRNWKAIGPSRRSRSSAS